MLDFFYDTSGKPHAMRHGYASNNNYTYYYYITNLQGDVIRLVDYLGNTAAYYEYDPYGNAIQAAGSHANVNPLRYRGYVYDTDTGLYYLQSRYYDPKLGRFINADSYASTGQGVLENNMFAYCNNNPCNKTDSSGQCSYFWFIKTEDCGKATCPDSKYYNPDAPLAIVIYDGRASGKPFPSRDEGDGVFQHQGQELVNRLSRYNHVIGFAYYTMDDFISIWNGLNGNYDAIYILGHGQPGKFNAADGSLRCCDSEYTYSRLDAVNAKEIYLYMCNGDTWPVGHTSTAYNFSNLTGAKVYAVRDGKLNFTWKNCYPYMSPKYWGRWTATTPSQ